MGFVHMTKINVLQLNHLLFSLAKISESDEAALVNSVSSDGFTMKDDQITLISYMIANNAFRMTQLPMKQELAPVLDRIVQFITKHEELVE